VVAGEQRGFDYISVAKRHGGSSVLEVAIDSLLDELGDESPFFEYWWRGKACDVHIHRDVDEKLNRRGERFCCAGLQRCPHHGHVLYMNVDDGLIAPTCVLDEAGTAGSGAPRALRALHTVPAVANRLLRFRGDALHGVPVPALRYIGADQCLARTGTLQSRAVLLFNTWTTPPQHSPSPWPSRVRHPLRDDKAAVSTPCLPQHEWASAPSVDGCGCVPMRGNPPEPAPETLASLHAPLLGDHIRSNSWAPALFARAPLEDLTGALLSPSKPHRVVLHEVETVHGSALRCMASCIAGKKKRASRTPCWTCSVAKTEGKPPSHAMAVGSHQRGRDALPSGQDLAPLL